MLEARPEPSDGGGRPDLPPWSRSTQGGDAIGVLERQVLREPAAHGDADEVRPRDAEGVEHPDGVRD